ncbi:MAG TPA: nucleoside hydrolase [Solirubrobacteraceae bacterium]|nr:nucleoside hydrolase [Solirubrobacteraceae bacterium]
MKPIIIDCDPGHDDAAALLLALASDEVELVGVTTVAGNQTLAKTTANAIRVLDCAGRADVPVAAGADRPLMRELHVAADIHGETGLEGAELPGPSRVPGDVHAVDWIAATLESAPERVTLVPTGPLTNIALLFARYPGIEARIERIVLMGGSIGEGNVTPAAEFNIWADPEAAHRVFSTDVDLTMVGLDVTHQALLTPDHLEVLEGAGEPGKLIADLYGFFLSIHGDRYGWVGAPVHDAVAVAHVIDASLLQTTRCGVTIDTGGELSRGRTNVDVRRQTDWLPLHHVAVDIAAGRFLALLVERISALGRAPAHSHLSPSPRPPG